MSISDLWSYIQQWVVKVALPIFNTPLVDCESLLPDRSFPHSVNNTAQCARRVRDALLFIIQGLTHHATKAVHMTLCDELADFSFSYGVYSTEASWNV